MEFSARLRRCARMSNLLALLCVVAMWLVVLQVFWVPPKSLPEKLTGDVAAEDGMDQEQLETVVPKELTWFRNEMRGRTDNVSALCKAGRSTVSYSNVQDYIVGDKKTSLLFCPVYKVASSSWLIAMLQMRGLWSPNNRVIQLNSIRKKTYPKLSSLKWNDFATRFMIVRHPFERLLSCYRDKYEQAAKEYYYNAYGKKMMKLFRERPIGLKDMQVVELLAKVDKDMGRERILGNLYASPVGPTFTEFVRYVVGPYNDDEHWRPYHKHCAPCAIHYNFILRFEDLEEEGPLFLRYLNAPETIQQRKENVFEGPATEDVACSYYAQLPSSVFNALVNKYKVDLDLYGYTPDKYANCDDEYVKQS